MPYLRRRDALRDRLPDDLAALLVTSPSNVRYLTGFTGSNGMLLLTRDLAQDRFGTDFRYVTQCAEQCPDLALVVSRELLAALGEYASENALGPLGFEAAHLTVRQHQALERAHGQLVPTDGVVEALRLVKDDGELELLARACEISDAALAELLPEVRVGVSERYLARRLEWLLLEHGAQAASFESIVAGGPNSAIPHHRPTDRALEAGDFLKIDFGALYGGYHADETRTFVVGAEPADWQREVYDLVATAQRAGVAALAVGADVKDVDAAARDLITAAGHGEHFGHGLGHGVGLDIHEAPTIGYGATGILADRTPVTVEPGVYLPGLGGVRIEDTLVVRAGGPVSLTRATRDLLVLGT